MKNFQHSFFESTAKKKPNLIAVDDEGKKTSYKELDISANKVANLLLKNGCRGNDRVCILVKKNVNLYISILGILKSGMCWVPLSSLFPKARLKELIKELNPKFIIVDSENFKIIQNLYKKNKTKILIIDKNFSKKNIFSKKDILKQSKIKPNIKIYSTDLAYIIFTSGSTGKPKGVMVTHHNTSHFLNNVEKYFKTPPKLRYAHIAEIVFDPSIFDLFVCWKYAGTVVPFNKPEYKVNHLKFFLDNKNINVCFFLPSFFKSLDDRDELTEKCLAGLKHIIFTGEPVPLDLVNNIQNKTKINLYNAYGTSEAAIISHWFKFKKFKKIDKISLGKELPNVKTILLRNNLKEAKINEAGEAYTLSPQVSAGYWNNSFLTKSCFIVNPLNKNFREIIYKTGDILKKDKNGDFYYVSRADNQIKLRGHRVELGEIENFIKNDVNVDDCIAVPFSNKDKNIFSDLFIFIKLKKKKKNFFL